MAFRARFSAHSMMFIMPVIGLISPFKDSSPANMESFTSRCKSCSESVRMANEIGKSKEVPLLDKLAGARFIVILCLGKVKPELVMAERIRSLLSAIDLLTIPTMLKQGRPERFMSPSTVINL